MRLHNVEFYSQKRLFGTSDNTAYTLRAYALAILDIAHFGRNVVYAENVRLSASSLFIQITVKMNSQSIFSS